MKMAIGIVLLSVSSVLKHLLLHSSCLKKGVSSKLHSLKFEKKKVTRARLFKTNDVVN